MNITPTQLRKDIYHILDTILETGQPIEITRKGQTLRITAMNPPSKLKDLKPLPNLINGNPASLEDIDWTGEWQP